MTEKADRFREQLRQEGRMPAFKARVKELRAKGVSRSESWNMAAAEFGYAPDKDRPQRPECEITEANAQLLEAESREEEEGAEGLRRTY